MKDNLARIWNWWATRNRALLPIIFADTAPLDLRIVGRMLAHAMLVGAAAGFIGAAFFRGLEIVQRIVLEGWAGYAPLRAHGESFVLDQPHPFRPWVLVFVPAIGGLITGWLSRLAPEIRGGGGDAMIDAFHHKGGIIRKRIIWLKAVASIATLGTGGAGGREGPTMQIGGAIGSAIARFLKVSTRERRILLVAGVAAGMSAVFRTPLGAALLAVEILYRDGFESDALVPSVLASVVSYSVVISIFGESTLFAHAPRFPFIPAHLPLYGALALVAAGTASIFVWALHHVRHFFAKLPGPDWSKPAMGGLALGILTTPMIIFLGSRVGSPGQGLGVLGGGYGAVQMAISGSAWLPTGWPAVRLLLLLAAVKIVASTMTIGSGGSAGDFAPSLAIGGVLGGAFGRIAQLLLHDGRIDPGAFALVGMGAFYGGIAHTPLSALVLVCELAGNYDLLVPLMLAQGIAFVALRRRALYEAQVLTQRDSPVHREAALFDFFKGITVRELMVAGRPFSSFQLHSTPAEMMAKVSEATWQGVFPVLKDDGALAGLVTATAVRTLALEGEANWAIAADLMQPVVSVTIDEGLRRATELMVANGLREMPVVDAANHVLGFIDESDIARIYLRVAQPAPEDVEAARSSSAESLPVQRH